MHLAMNLMQTCKDAQNGQGKLFLPFQPHSSYPHNGPENQSMEMS